MFSRVLAEVQPSEKAKFSNEDGRLMLTSRRAYSHKVDHTTAEERNKFSSYALSPKWLNQMKIVSIKLSGTLLCNNASLKRINLCNLFFTIPRHCRIVIEQPNVRHGSNHFNLTIIYRGGEISGDLGDCSSGRTIEGVS